MSAAMFELVMKSRVARRVEDRDDVTLKAIASASVPPTYAKLDELLDGWTP